MTVSFTNLGIMPSQDKTSEMIDQMSTVDVSIRKVRHFHKEINHLSEASRDKSEAAIAMEGFFQHVTRVAEKFNNNTYFDMLKVRNAVCEKHPGLRELFNACITTMGTKGQSTSFELSAHFQPSPILGVWSRTIHKTTRSQS